MKNLYKEFISSVYNPQFYKDISSKSLRSIFVYICKIDLIVSIILTILSAIILGLNMNQSAQVSGLALAISYVFGILSIFATMFLTMLIIWILYGLVFGVLILITSIIIKKRISYAISIKTAIYSMSLGIIFIVIPKSSEIISWLGIAISVLIVIVNLKNKSPNITVVKN